jgi:hypothetical protein
VLFKQASRSRGAYFLLWLDGPWVTHAESDVMLGKGPCQQALSDTDRQEDPKWKTSD